EDEAGTAWSSWCLHPWLFFPYLSIIKLIIDYDSPSAVASSIHASRSKSSLFPSSSPSASSSGAASSSSLLLFSPLPIHHIPSSTGRFAHGEEGVLKEIIFLRLFSLLNH
ncbi:hypothetical protein Dimus_033657, partial [Dionaea muscipula]